MPVGNLGNYKKMLRNFFSKNLGAPVGFIQETLEVLQECLYGFIRQLIQLN